MIDLEKISDRTSVTPSHGTNGIQQPANPPSNAPTPNNSTGRGIFIILGILLLGVLFFFFSRTNASDGTRDIGNTLQTENNKRSFGTFSYKRYENYRGWSIDVPSFMKPRSVPENNDGSSFYWDNRNYLQAYGCYNYGVTIDELYEEDTTSGNGTVDYKIKKSKWYVVSGRTSDGLIYYKKVAFLEYDGLEVIATAMLIYEPVYNKDFDPVITHIFPKFPK